MKIPPTPPRVSGSAPAQAGETGRAKGTSGKAKEASAAGSAVQLRPMSALLELLAAEQDALRSANADALARIVPQKVAQVHALRSMSVARTALLRSAGLTTDAAGMRTLLGRSPDPERAGEQWQTLTRLAVEAQRVNALNIRLAHAQQRHVDQAM